MKNNPFSLLLTGTLSDSGRNSMSSLPTHSTSGSLNASTGPVNHGDGSSAPANCLSKGVQRNFSPWVNGNSANTDSSYGAGFNSGGLAPKANGDAGSLLSANEPSPHTETLGGIRSPLTTDESLIEHLEQRLLERETELQELQVLSCHAAKNTSLRSILLIRVSLYCLRSIYWGFFPLQQVSFEEKEVDTCQIFEERQKYCTEEMEGLKQRCSTKLQQVSQMAAKTHQALQLQVSQLQVSPSPLFHHPTKPPPFSMNQLMNQSFQIFDTCRNKWNEMQILL